MVSDLGTLRHLLIKPNDRLNIRQARYARDLQPFTDATTLAYRNGSRNEANPLSRRADFHAHASHALLWDGDVSQYVNLREHSHLPRNHDAPMASPNLRHDLSSLSAHFMRIYQKLSEMVRLGNTKDSFYVNDGEWTKGGQIIARHVCFWRNARLSIPNDPIHC
jgi:hypothetical protein